MYPTEDDIERMRADDDGMLPVEEDTDDTIAEVEEERSQMARDCRSSSIGAAIYRRHVISGVPGMVP